MKRKIFSKLLMGALLIASVSSFVSCKDYDDDINRLEDQINKAALQSNLDAFQQKVDQNATTAAAAAANALKAAQDAAAAATNADATLKSDLEKAIAAVEKTANTNGTNLADAVKAISDLQAAVKAAQDAADAAATAAAGADAKAGAAATPADVEKAAADAKAALDKAVSELNAAIEAAQKAALEAAQKAQTTADAAATKAYADDIKTLAEEAKTIANEAKAALANYASKEEFNTLSTKVDDLNTDLTQKIGTINSKIADIEANYATKTYVDDKVAGLQNADQVKAAIESALAQYGLSKADETVASQISTAVTSLQGELAQAFGVAEFSAIQAKFSSVNSAVDAIYSVVTSVSIWASHHDLSVNYYSRNLSTTVYDNTTNTPTGYTSFRYWYYRTDYSEPAITFIQVQEKENKFPVDAKKAEADNQYTFANGKYVTYEDQIIIRVSPANATITPDMIELINSQGEAIPSELIEITDVQPSTELLTRAAGGNGLWVVSFKLKDGYSADDLNAVATTKVNNVTKNVLFAVAVNNTKESAAGRRVVSEYDLTVGTQSASHANNFTVKVGDDNAELITNIRNRYWQTETGASTSDVEELIWDATVTDGAVAPIFSGAAKNVITRKNSSGTDVNTDDRQSCRILYADVNENIVIEYPTIRPLKGFYVTLDRDFAIESAPSEINAWDSYTYTNVGTKSKAAHMFDGNVGTIAVNSANAEGDYIGFRVYAVNLDGTLVDPDGRAFYIHVGRLEGTTQNCAADVVADRITATSKVAKTVTFDNWNDNRVYYSWSIKDAAIEFPYSAVPTINKINYVKANGALVTSVNWGDLTQLTAAQANDVKGITVEFNDIAQLYNDQTITLEGKAYKRISAGGYAQYMEIGLIEAKITKVMATFPTQLQGRAAQFTNANATDHFSGGTLNLFLLEDANDFTLGSWTGAALTQGSCDLVSAFYNLDVKASGASYAGDGKYDPARYTFTFATSLKNADGALINKSAGMTGGLGTDLSKYKFAYSVAKGFIDNTTAHNTIVAYDFGPISTYKKADGSIVYGEPWKPSKSFTTIYDCLWDSQWMSYAWKENKEENVPSFTVGDTGKTIDLNTVYSKNAYNATVYGEDYKTITLDQFAQALTFSDPKLTSDETGVQDYFKCSISGTIISLTPQEDWHNPVHDVLSTLSLKATDQFGHSQTIKLKVWVKKQ